MTISKDPLAEIPFVTNASVRSSTISEFIITNFDGSNSLDISPAIAEFYFYESVLSNTISATVMIVDTGFITSDGEIDKEDTSRKRTPGIISTLGLKGGERVDFKITNPNPLVQPDNNDGDGLLTVQQGMYINRIRDISNNSQKDLFALDLVPSEFINNEKTRVIGRYDGSISDHVSDIVSNVLGTSLPVTVNKTAFNYNFIGNDRKPFYICTWLASKAVPEGNDGDGKPLSNGGAGYLFYQTRDSFQFRAIDRLLSKDSTDTISKEKVKRYIYNNTGSAVPIEVDEFDGNILNYAFTRSTDVSKDLSLGSYNNRSIFFDPFSMNYKVKNFKFDDQSINYTNKLRNIPEVENITNGPTRLMSHVLDTGTMPAGTTSDAQLKKWKDDITDPNYDAENIMVQSVMRYNQLFSLQLNITLPGDFSIKAGDRIECKFADLTHDDDANNQLSGIYMVASVCHRVTSQDTFSSLDLVSDSLYTKKGKK